MKSFQNKNLENLLLDILDSTQKLESEIISDELNIDLISKLVASRGDKINRFTDVYELVKENKPTNDKYLETFTKIYSQVIKKQQELVDTTNIKINSISKELSSIRKERKMRSSYNANQYSEQLNNSVLITSKIQG